MYTVNHRKLQLNAEELPDADSIYLRAYAENYAGVSYGETKSISRSFIKLPLSGIAVQKEDIGRGDWNDVKGMCETSALGGYTDWRLPTLEELRAMYNQKDLIGNFYGHDYDYDSHSYWSEYWSSTPYSDYYYNMYYYIDFYDGESDTDMKSETKSARCVRTLDSQ